VTALPVLYSFRRCPYAMRARMALWISRTACELREVVLADKPPELLAASPKGTVPVLVAPDGTVIDESLAIMRWALARRDPEGWLAGDDPALIAANDGAFKHDLDRYKYPARYPGCDPHQHREQGLEFLRGLEARLAAAPNLAGPHRTLADIALFPFVRQFAHTDRAWFAAQSLPRLRDWLERHLASDLFAAIMPKFAPWAAGDAPVRFGP
jgi:glutathione S-transferase